MRDERGRNDTTYETKTDAFLKQNIIRNADNENSFLIARADRISISTAVDFDMEGKHIVNIANGTEP